MKIPKQVVETIEAQTISISAKVRNGGSYFLIDDSGEQVADIEDYVPSFFPSDHYGDYWQFDIDLETGQIKNWKKPDPEVLARFFGLLKD